MPMLSRWAALALVAASFTMCPATARTMPAVPVSIADCIAMVRIQSQAENGGNGVATFAPDGKRFAAVVWRGDLARNVNRYTLLVFDANAAGGWSGPRAILSVDDSHDVDSRHIVPIGDLAFFDRNRSIAFIGTLHGEPPQVYAVDIGRERVRALTHHPTAVRSFAITPAGAVRFYVAASQPDAAAVRRRIDGGFSLDEPDVAGRSVTDYAFGRWTTATRQYFFQPAQRRPPRLVFDARGVVNATQADAAAQTVALAVAPDGKHAIATLYGTAAQPPNTDRYSELNKVTIPYARLMIAEYGLVDLQTGRIEPLLEAPYFPFEASARNVVWAPDSGSVLVGTYLPLDGNIATNESRAKDGQHLYEIDIRTRRAVRVDPSDHFSALGWDARSNDVLLAERRRGTEIALVHRGRDGWDAPRVIGSTGEVGFNARYGLTLAGTTVVGVADSLTTPPDFAIYDVATKVRRTLTDLNPALRARRYGEARMIHWTDAGGDDGHVGYLVKPLDYVPGRRYPLALEWKDEGYGTSDSSFLIDGGDQLSALAVQTLAADGFVVLYTPSPLALRAAINSPREGPVVSEHVRSAIAELDRQGLIDPTRVAISGWSRTSNHTRYILQHTSIPFAAAELIDNASLYTLNSYVMSNNVQNTWDDDRQNWGGNLPWGPTHDAWLAQAADFSFDGIRTPVMLEVHGPPSLLNAAEVWAALKTLHKPVDVFYYPLGAHNLNLPMERLSSMNRHVDWYRFWLQGYEDPDTMKHDQYRRWRGLRALGDAPR